MVWLLSERALYQLVSCKIHSKALTLILGQIIAWWSFIWSWWLILLQCVHCVACCSCLGSWINRWNGWCKKVGCYWVNRLQVWVFVPFALIMLIAFWGSRGFSNPIHESEILIIPPDPGWDIVRFNESLELISCGYYDAIDAGFAAVSEMTTWQHVYEHEKWARSEEEEEEETTDRHDWLSDRASVCAKWRCDELNMSEIQNWKRDWRFKADYWK